MRLESRGYGAFVDNSSEPVLFILQHRSIEPGAPNPVYEHGPLTLVAEIGILHCPWCGRELAKWYRSDVKHLSRPDLTTAPV
jgi:hypothetical protein